MTPTGPILVDGDRKSWRCDLGHLHRSKTAAHRCDRRLGRRRRRRLKRAAAFDQVPIPL